MSVTNKRGTWILAGTLWALGSGIPAFADDTELFVSDSSQFVDIVRPNILFIMDTSGSMDNEVESLGPYDPSEEYDGDCGESRVYWRTGTGTPVACTTSQWLNMSALKCDIAIQAFAAGVRVTRATAYFVNGAPLEFADFLEAAEAIRRMGGGNRNTAVYLFFDIESRRISRLKIDNFGG